MALGERFGAGIHTFPLSVRAAVSVPIVLWNAWLMFEVIMWSLDGDPRPTALWLVVLAPSLFMTVAFMKELWRSRHEWHAERRDEGRAEFALEQRLAWSVPEREFPEATYGGVIRDLAEVAPEWTQPPPSTTEGQREMSISLKPLPLPRDSQKSPAPFAYPESDRTQAHSPAEP